MTVISDVHGLNIVINVPIVNGAGYAHLAVCRVKTANIAGSVRELQVPVQSVVDIEVNVHNKLKKWDITYISCPRICCDVTCQYYERTKINFLSHVIPSLKNILT